MGFIHIGPPMPPWYSGPNTGVRLPGPARSIAGGLRIRTNNHSLPTHHNPEHRIRARSGSYRFIIILYAVSVQPVLPVRSLNSERPHGLVRPIYVRQVDSIANLRFSLEFNIRQLILSDLASNIGESKHEPESPDVLSAIDLVTSKVETRVLHEEAPDESEDGRDEEELRVFMVS